MAFSALPEPAYSAVEEHYVGRPCGMRRALLTGLVVALVGTACFCARSETRNLRAQTAALVVLDGETATQDAGKGAPITKPDSKGGSASTVKPAEGASDNASAVKPDSEGASGGASAVKPESDFASGNASVGKLAAEAASGGASAVKPESDFASGNASTVKPDPEGASGGASAVKPESDLGSGNASTVKPDPGASAVKPESDFATSAGKPDPEGATGGAAAVKPESDVASGSASAEKSAFEGTRGSASAVKSDNSGDSRHELNSSTAPPSTTTESSVGSGSAVKPDSKESPWRVRQQRLRVVLASAAAEAAALCIKHDVAYVPLDMPKHDVSYESSLDACQVRCAAVEGCETFTFFPADKSCHVQDGSTAELSSVGARSGRPTCDAMAFKRV